MVRILATLLLALTLGMSSSINCKKEICVLLLWTEDFEEKGCVEFYRKYLRGDILDLNEADIYLKKIREEVKKRFGKDIEVEEPIISFKVLENQREAGFKYFKVGDRTKDFNCKKYGVYGAVIPSTYGRVKLSIYVVTPPFKKLSSEEKLKISKRLKRVRNFLEENLFKILGWR